MFQRKTRWADCAVITSAHKSLTKRYATPAGGRLPNRSRPRWSRGLRSGRKVAAMSERRRNPRRRIVDVRTECGPYGQAMVSVHYCVLECGHMVVGYPDTLDGRKACPECGRGKQC